MRLFSLLLLVLFSPVAGAQLGELLVSASRRDRRDLRM